MFEEFALPITTIASVRRASSRSAVWRFVVAKHRSSRVAVQSSGNRSTRLVMMPFQSSSESVVCASSATFDGSLDRGEHTVEVGFRLHQAHLIGRHRHRAGGLVVAVVTDVEDRVALTGPHFGLVVHLGDERAHRVHDDTPLVPRRRHHLGRRSVRRQHERCARGNGVDVVDEDHALVAEPVDHELVVHDLVVAVDGRVERLHHPRQRLDRHLDARTEPAGLGEEHAFDTHPGTSVPVREF